MSETALVFLLCFFLGLILAVVVRPMYGLYTYIGVFYVHPPSRWWAAELPDLRWSLVAAVVTLIAVLRHRGSNKQRPAWYSSPIAIVLILYTTWMWLQAPWVVAGNHLEGTILFTKYVLLFYLMHAIIDNDRDFFGFCFAHVLGCAYLGWLIYIAPDTGRLESVGGPDINNANTLGMHLATGLIFAAFLLLASRGWIRWALIGTIPLIVNGIIQTETRGALVGLVVGGLATVYLKPKKFRRIYYALSVAAIACVLTLSNEVFIDRMATLTAAVDDEKEWDSSATNRIETVKAQVRMFADYPFGAGHQGTATLSPAYMEERWLAPNSGTRDSHNTVMSVVVDQGIPGILLMCVLSLTIMRMLRTLKKLDAIGLPDQLGLYRAALGGALVTIFAAGMFAQYLKSEAHLWCLALLTILWEFSVNAKRSIESPRGSPEGSIEPKLKVERAGGGRRPTIRPSPVQRVASRRD